MKSGTRGIKIIWAYPHLRHGYPDIHLEDMDFELDHVPAIEETIRLVAAEGVPHFIVKVVAVEHIVRPATEHQDACHIIEVQVVPS